MTVLSQRLIDGAFAFLALVLGWYLVPSDPSWPQLAAVALYAAFALAILLVRR